MDPKNRPGAATYDAFAKARGLPTGRQSRAGQGKGRDGDGDGIANERAKAAPKGAAAGAKAAGLNDYGDGTFGRSDFPDAMAAKKAMEAGGWTRTAVAFDGATLTTRATWRHKNGAVMRSVGRARSVTVAARPGRPASTASMYSLVLRPDAP